MSYKGVIIEESLENKDVLKDVTILSTKVEEVTERDKVFKVDRSKPEEYKEVTQYGVSLGIPDYQLDFSPHTAEWTRVDSN